jgi:uncharacterized HhH-GPD family protein
MAGEPVTRFDVLGLEGNQDQDRHTSGAIFTLTKTGVGHRFSARSNLSAMATATRPDRLHFTGNDEADRLNATDPFALVMGFALDQQVPVQTAFSGPLKLKQRLGTLDPGKVAATDPAKLEAAFREKPAIHRFPGNMARRVQELAAVVTDEYAGDASRIWNEAADSTELRRRISELPGFGDMKIKAFGAVLAKRFGVEAARELAPSHPTLGDVDSPEALARYQAMKREHKARLKAQRQ